MASPTSHGGGAPRRSGAPSASPALLLCRVPESGALIREGGGSRSLTTRRGTISNSDTRSPPSSSPPTSTAGGPDAALAAASASATAADGAGAAAGAGLKMPATESTRSSTAGDERRHRVRWAAVVAGAASSPVGCAEIEGPSCGGGASARTATPSAQTPPWWW